MRIAYFDCFSGISGDMTVGALLNAGLPLEFLRSELRKLDISGYEISARTLERSMIAATKFDVGVEMRDYAHEHLHEHSHEHLHEHSHEHLHEHSHEHLHEHSHEHAHEHAHGHEHHHHHTHGHDEYLTPEAFEDGDTHVHTHGLSYKEILSIIERSGLSDRVKLKSVAIFRVIAEAEAVIHGVALEDVHFHEVGAIDSIVDIVSTAIGLEHFGVEECRSRTVPLGAGGLVTTAHGRMPIPTPATLAILAGYPTELGQTKAELTTPTGAGIIKALSSGILGDHEVLRVEAIGYGAGTKEFSEQPNLLRLVIGELDAHVKHASSFPEIDTVTQLTASIDDMTPVELAHVQERLIEIGALECYLRPIQMKKGRPASELVVLCQSESEEEILTVIEQETTTIGIRVERVERRKSARALGVGQHPEFGAFQYKEIAGAHARREPEYEDAKRISRELGLPLREVMEELRNALRTENGGRR